jgi:hypothetical protein
MYVVRLKSIDSVHLRSFTSRSLPLSGFESGQDAVIAENMKEAATFDIAAADDPRTAVRLVRQDGIASSEILPQPMTEAQAAAWLADLYL